MDAEIDDYTEPEPEEQAVQAAEIEAEQTRPRKVKKPIPEVSARTTLARMNVLAQLGRHES